MLISMPTGTSTIFGVFQLIRVSPKQCWHDVRTSIETRLTSNVAQARNIRCRRHTDASDAGNFPLGQSHFALGQGERTKATDRRMRRFGHVSQMSVCLPQAPVANGDLRRVAAAHAEAPTIRHRLSFTSQQSLSSVSPVLVKRARRDERLPSRCPQVSGGDVNLAMFNLTSEFFDEDSLWNQFTEG